MKFFTRPLHFYILIFVFFSIDLFAQNDFQPGYVLTLDKDTLYGQINLQAIARMCRTCLFRFDKGAEPIEYLPGEITGYRFIGGRYFISRDVEIEGDTQQVFLEFLVDGISDLYYFQATHNNYYFLEKDTIGLVLLDNEELSFVNEYGDEKIRRIERYKGVLKYSFSDDPGIFPEIDHTNFNHKSLIDITTRYHTDICPDETCLVFTKSGTGRFFMGPKIGYRYTALGYSTSQAHAYSNDPEFGLQFRSIPLKLLQCWNTLINLLYSRNEYLGDFPNTVYSNMERIFRIHLKYDMIRVPVVIEYSFFQKKIQPVVSVGIDNVFLFNADNAIELVDRGSGTVLNPDMSFQKYNFGLLAGLGVNMKLNERMILTVKGEYSYRMPPADFNDYLDYVRYNSGALYLGLEYRL